MSTEVEYDELYNRITWTSKSIKALNVVNEILSNYWNVPAFITSLQDISMPLPQNREVEISIEDIPF
jgi:hypothetical protein